MGATVEERKIERKKLSPEEKKALKAKRWKTFKFVATTVFVPFIGPAIMDYYYHENEEDDPAPTTPTCCIPQSKWDGCGAFLSVPIRPAIAAYILCQYVPVIWAAKWGAGSYCAVLVGLAVMLSCALMVLNLCCPSMISAVRTDPMYDVFTTVIEIKTTHAAQRKKQGFKWVLKRGWKYFVNTIYAVFLCRIFRPSAIYTFAKTLASLIITDVAMAVTVWLYITARFLVGSFTWTVFSAKGWMKELMICNNIKNRIMFLAYPEWDEESAGKEKNPIPVKPDIKAALPKCGCMKCPGCPSCPGCPNCALACCTFLLKCPQLLCSMCCQCCDFDLICEFMCTMFQFGIELCDNLVSILGLVGKALVYTNIQMGLVTDEHMKTKSKLAWAYKKEELGA